MSTQITENGKRRYERRHSGIAIEPAIRELKNGYNPLSCPPGKTLVLLTQARADGFKVYTPGCDDVDARGHCKGHPMTEQEAAEERRRNLTF